MIPDKEILYIAGPYRAKTIHQIAYNIAQARRRMEWAWVNGYVPICPHMNSAFIDGLIPDEEILAGYIQIVDRCDKILMMDGWPSSSGAAAEFRRAKEEKKGIIWDPLK